SLDGRIVARCDQDYVIRLWSMTTGKELGPRSGHQGPIRALTFAADGRSLATGADDRTIRFWEVGTGRQRLCLEEQATPLLSLARSPDGKSLASVSQNGAIGLWDWPTGKRLRQVKGAALGRLGKHYSPPVPGAPAGESGVRTFSPNGELLASGYNDGSARLVEAATGKELWRSMGHTWPLYALAFSPDGKLLATGGWDQKVRLWDVATGKERHVLSGHRSAIRGLAFSPDGSILASTGGEDRDIRLWEPSKGRELRQPLAHPNDLFALAFSEDGRVLASAGKGGTVYLWEVATGAQRHQFRGHHGDVLCLAFSADCKHLASAGEDAIALVWTVLGGIARKAGADAKMSPKELATLWADLLGEPGQAYRAMCRLTAAPSEAVSLFRMHLHPVVARVEGPALARLIADLDSDEFTARERATRELEALGELAIPALRRVQSGRPSLE